MSSRQAPPSRQTAAWCSGCGPASSGAPAGSAIWCRCNTRRAPRRCWSCSMRRGPGRRSTPTISGTCATSGSPCSGWTQRWGAHEARPSASPPALVRPPRGTRASAAARGRSLALAPAAGLTADADRDDRRAADRQHPRGARADRLRRPSRRPRVRSRLGPDRQDRRRGELFRLRGLDGVTQRFSLRSPIDGEVVARAANPGTDVQGQLSGGAAPELFTIGSLDSVWAFADVYEADLARVTLGASVRVKVIAYPDRSFPGRIEWISSTLDPVTRTARLRCTLGNPDRALLPEMYA